MCAQCERQPRRVCSRGLGSTGTERACGDWGAQGLGSNGDWGAQGLGSIRDWEHGDWGALGTGEHTGTGEHGDWEGPGAPRVSPTSVLPGVPAQNPGSRARSLRPERLPGSGLALADAELVTLTASGLSL